jgi:hypothetical protein
MAPPARAEGREEARDGEGTPRAVKGEGRRNVKAFASSSGTMVSVMIPSANMSTARLVHLVVRLPLATGHGVQAVAGTEAREGRILRFVVTGRLRGIVKREINVTSFIHRDRSLRYLQPLIRAQMANRRRPVEGHLTVLLAAGLTALDGAEVPTKANAR